MSRGLGRVQREILQRLAEGAVRGKRYRGYTLHNLTWAVFGPAKNARRKADHAAVIRRSLARLVADGLVVFLPSVGKWGDDAWELKKPPGAEARRKARAEAKAREEAARREREKAWQARQREARKADPKTDTRIKIAKVLGMLGSTHDGEVLTAGRQAERLRTTLGVGWEELLGL